MSGENRFLDGLNFAIDNVYKFYRLMFGPGGTLMSHYRSQTAAPRATRSASSQAARFRNGLESLAVGLAFWFTAAMVFGAFR